MNDNISLILEVQDAFIKSIVSNLWTFIKAVWVAYWPYIIIFFVLVFIGMAWQIIWFRTGSNKKMPRWFNALVGSIFYWFFFYLVVTILYFIFGSQVIDGIWFAAISYPIYRLNKIFLKWIGFWKY